MIKWGGGFHRYATDPEWLVPHFEKMLYNQAQLAEIYLEAYQLTGDWLYAHTAQRTLNHVLREMRTPEGGFVSASDADSLGKTGEIEEGAFFVWLPVEVQEILNAKDAAAFIERFDISEEGNFEGHSIPNLDEALTQEEAQRFAPVFEELYQARFKRPQPLVDDKVIAHWNGLMIKAFAFAARTLAQDFPEAAQRYHEAAMTAADVLWQRAWNAEQNQLSRLLKDGKPGPHRAVLDDYAAMVRAYTALYDLTGDAVWLDRAQKLADVMIPTFQDKQAGDFYLTASAEGGLIARPKEIYDGALASGNSLALEALILLNERRAEFRYDQAITESLKALSGNAVHYARTYPYALMAGDRFTNGATADLVYGAAGHVKAQIQRQDDHLVVVIDMDPNWHIQAHLPSDPDYIPTVLEGKGLENITYPTPIRRALGFSDIPLDMYEGRITIAAKAAQTPHQISLTLQACDDQICLPPETLKLTVPQS